MVPKINSRGRSFKGLTSYLMNGETGQEQDRVAWTHTGNLATDNVNTAALLMAWTDKHADELKAASGGASTGRKASAGAVYHYSLSWAKEEDPDEAHMKLAAYQTLERLGLQDHQFYIVAHNDTDHKHVHVVVNLTHHETGKRTDPGLSKRALQEWALEYEREHGIQCEMREKNAQARDEGIQTKHQDKKRDYSQEVSRAFVQSDNGQSFRAALEHEGLFLAKGRRGDRLVLVDTRGDIQNLARQLEIEERGRAKTEAINRKLADINRLALPDAEELAARFRAERTESGESSGQIEQDKRKKLAQDARAGHASAEELEARDAQRRLERVIAAGLERTGPQRQPIFYVRLNEIYHSGAGGEQFREKIWKELNVSLTKDEKTERFMLVDGRGRVYNLNTLIEVRDMDLIESHVTTRADISNQESVDRVIRSAKMSALEDRLSTIDKRQLESAQELSHAVKWSHYRNLPAKEHAIDESRAYWKVERAARAVEDAHWRTRKNEGQSFLWRTMNKQKIEADLAELERQKGLLYEVKSRHADDVKAIYRSAPEKLRNEKLEELQLKGYDYRGRSEEHSFDILEREKKLAFSDYKRNVLALQSLDRQKEAGMFQGLSPGEARDKERRIGQLRESVEIYEEHYGFHLLDQNKSRQSQGQAQGLDAGLPGADSQGPQKDKSKEPDEPLEDQAERFAQLQKDLQESSEEEQRRKRFGLDQGGPGKGIGI